MAGAGNNAVRIAALDHHAGVVHILVVQKVFSLLAGHALGFTKLDQLLDVFFGLRIGLRIDDLSAGNIQAFAILGNFFRAADDDEVSNAFLKGAFRGLEGTAIHGLRQYDGLLILFCALFHAIQK